MIRRGEGLIATELRGQRRGTWLSKSDIVVFTLGTVLIASFALGVFQRDYRTTLDLWKSRLTAAVRYRAWTLQNSLQQSEDDVQVLADFASTREMLLFAAGGGIGSLPCAAARRQVLGLFENYRNVYQYAAVFLLSGEGNIVVQATDSGAWPTLIGTLEFQGVLRTAIDTQHYTIHLVPISEQELALVFMMPVVSGDPTDKKPHVPLGVVTILDPFGRELLPLLRAESIPSRTGETIFFRSEAGEGRYASPLRFGSSSRTGHIRREDTLIRAASAAVEDHANFGQFVDYRGVDVLASMQKVPGLRGVVLGKVDSTEAFAEFHRTWRLEMMTAAAVVLAFLGMILLRRRNAVAREMKEIEDSLRTAKQVLEM